MATYETGYQPLHSCHDNGEDTPQDNEVLFHVVPESSKARWNHIEDLDSFFTRIYQYHQKHGFTCMMLQEFLELVQFVFIVLFSTYLLQCVDYPILFQDVPPRNLNNNSTFHKITISQALIPLNECVVNLNGIVIIYLIVAFIFWIFRVMKVAYHFFQFVDIKAFYNFALKISESEIDNMTWHEVQSRMQKVQKEQQMCIHKQELTELDIYHRILRFKNYMVAMLNKCLLPVKFRVPFLGEIIFMTKGLKYNFELILFWGPGSPFENFFHLKDEYKKSSKRKELAEQLSKRILWIGIANFVLCPLILVWQVLYFFFNYAEVIKREPGSLGARRWSIYGRVYLRHFNELDHELNARLNRAYKLSSRYMNIFTSHILTIIAKNIVFFTGSILAVLIILTLRDEDVLQVEHILATITVLGVIIALCRVFIPDEHLVWCPEKLMMSILAHIHYMPDSWKGNAHTTRVRDEFSQLFQYKAVYLLEELVSPIVTPFILCFFLRHRALDIVDFYRNFTVDVIGVGDICSFAQMDIRKHGNPNWMSETLSQANQCQQAEDGKTELSLMHFTLTNPEWKPPADSETFITNIRKQAHKDVGMLGMIQEDNPVYYSLHSMSSLGGGYSSLATSILRPQFGGSPAPEQTVPKSLTTMKGGLSRAEGPLTLGKSAFLSSLHPAGNSHALYQEPLMQLPSCSNVEQSQMMMTPNDEHQAPLEYTAADMSFSALYMHELHHQRNRLNSYADSYSQSVWHHQPHAHGSNMTNIQELPQEDMAAERDETIPLLEARASKST